MTLRYQFSKRLTASYSTSFSLKTLVLAALGAVSIMSIQASPAQTAEQLFSSQPTATPELANGGEFAVGVQTLELSNPNQINAKDFQSVYDRPITVEVWYPAASSSKTDAAKAVYQDQTRSGKPFSLQGEAIRDANENSELSSAPLIILSHGYTGYRSMMFYLAEHLASHGYVVAAIDHTDSTNKDIDFTKNASAGFPSTLYNRARDQQFVLQALTQSGAPFSKLIDQDTAAIVGYSMGGYGALNTVGGCYEFSKEFVQGMGIPSEQSEALSKVLSSCSAGREKADPRWKAMIAFAPWGGEQGVHQAQSLANISVPSLIVAGDYDDVSGYEAGVKKLYEQLGSEHKYLLVYQNARHNIVAHPAPQAAFDNDLDLGHYFEPAWNSETITRINKHMVLAFLNAHLKNDAQAAKYLPTREFATQIKQTDGKLTEPWSGFPDRWGVGLQFLRSK